MNPPDPFEGATALHWSVWTVRFLLELALMAGIAALAWHLTRGWWRWPAAIGAIAACLTVWSLFISPKAEIPLPAPAALAIEAALFLGTAAGLWAIRLGLPAAVGLAIWVAHHIALALLSDR